MAQRTEASAWSRAVAFVRQVLRRTSTGRLVAVGIGCVVIVVLGAASLYAGFAASESILVERASEADEAAPVEHAPDEDVSDEDAPGEDVPNASADNEAMPEVVVDVAGAVMAPDVITLPEGARVADAIEAAGGLAPTADLSTINRAAKLTDGMKLYIPHVGEAAPATGTASSEASAPEAATTLVNINTAGEAELDALPGVGPSTAQAIIKERDTNGPFAAPEDIMRVSGIGEKKFENLKDFICV